MSPLTNNYFHGALSALMMAIGLIQSGCTTGAPECVSGDPYGLAFYHDNAGLIKSVKIYKSLRSQYQWQELSSDVARDNLFVFSQTLDCQSNVYDYLLLVDIGVANKFILVGPLVI